MSVLLAVADVVAWFATVGLIGRAVWRLHRYPDRPHAELVPPWERHLTTALGVPVTLVALSTLVDGPFALPALSASLLLVGPVLFLYPDFAPSTVSV